MLLRYIIKAKEKKKKKRKKEKRKPLPHVPEHRTCLPARN